MKAYFPVAVSLLVGAAVGYCLAPSAPAVAAEPESGREKSAEPLRDDGDKASVKALRSRIRELEGLLAKKGEDAAMREGASAGERVRSRRFDFRAEMERIKKEEPERYAQMTNGMARFRQHRLRVAQRKMDILGSIDTSAMSASARRTHEEFQDAIERREAVEDKMRGFMDMTEDERRSVMEEMRDVQAKMRELGEAERENLLLQTARALGYDGDDAEEIAATVREIYEATEFDRGFMHGGGQGSRGGRGRRAHD